MHFAAWTLLILGQAAAGSPAPAKPPVTLLTGAELVSTMVLVVWGLRLQR